MYIKKLFRQGNSWSLVIPTDLLREITPGPDNHVVLRTPAPGVVTIESLDRFIATHPRATYTPTRTN